VEVPDEGLFALLYSIPQLVMPHKVLQFVVLEKKEPSGIT